MNTDTDFRVGVWEGGGAVGVVRGKYPYTVFYMFNYIEKCRKIPPNYPSYSYSGPSLFYHIFSSFQVCGPHLSYCTFSCNTAQIMQFISLIIPYLYFVQLKMENWYFINRLAVHIYKRLMNQHSKLLKQVMCLISRLIKSVLQNLI